MNTIWRGITIDNGGSSIRMIPGGLHSEDDVIEINSDIIKIPKQTFRPKETEHPEEVVDVIESTNSEFEGLYVAGETAANYSGVRVAIDSSMNKSECRDYFIQFIYGIAREIISTYDPETFTIQGDKCRYDVDTPMQMVVGTIIPVQEYSGDKDLVTPMKERLQGIYRIEFPLLPRKPIIEFAITADNIGVSSEGAVIMMMYRKTIKNTDITVVSDIGHATHDIAVYEGLKLLRRNVKSSQDTGGLLMTLIKSALVNAGYKVNDDINILEALNTGKIYWQGKYPDVSDIVEQAKDLFVANFVKPDIAEVLRLNGKNAGEVVNFIPAGELYNHNPRTGSLEQKVKDACGFDFANILMPCANRRYANVVCTTPYVDFKLKKLRAI